MLRHLIEKILPVFPPAVLDFSFPIFITNTFLLLFLNRLIINSTLSFTIHLLSSIQHRASSIDYHASRIHRIFIYRNKDPVHSLQLFYQPAVYSALQLCGLHRQKARHKCRKFSSYLHLHRTAPM